MNRLDIYTDGSHLDKLNKGRLGCGGVAIDKSKPKDNQIVGTFSQELTPEFMKMNYGTDNCSNPTAEMMGVYCALVHFKKQIKEATIIVIHSDYVGVQSWMQGKWRIKEAYIQKIKNDIDEEIKEQGLDKKSLKFEWVKGHQTNLTDPDAYWNSIVDKLAKGILDEKGE